MWIVRLALRRRYTFVVMALLTEVQLPNSEGTLLPGMYVQVQFAFVRPNPPLLVPANALIVRADGPQVALISAAHLVHYQTIEVGRDDGTEVEVTAGLQDQDVVVANFSPFLLSWFSWQSKSDMQQHKIILTSAAK